MNATGDGPSDGNGRTGTPTRPIETELPALLKHQRESLSAYFWDFDHKLDSPLLQLKFHVLLSDLRGPRLQDLVDKLLDCLADYAIPRSRQGEAHRRTAATNSSEFHSRLLREARKRFTQLARSGENGEVLLYLLAESKLGYPQLLCKMAMKTDSALHYQGADGVHISVDPEGGHLRFHWGESKLHAEATNAIVTCFKDLAGYVLALGDEGRDLELIRDNIDLDNPVLEQALLRYLDPDDPLFLKRKYCGIAVIGFDLQDYPNTTSSDRKEVLSKLQPLMERWASTIGDAINRNNLATSHVDVFCIPLPDVAQFRTLFLKMVDNNAA